MTAYSPKLPSPRLLWLARSPIAMKPFQVTVSHRFPQIMKPVTPVAVTVIHLCQKCLVVWTSQDSLLHSAHLVISCSCWCGACIHWLLLVLQRPFYLILFSSRYFSFLLFSDDHWTEDGRTGSYLKLHQIYLFLHSVQVFYKHGPSSYKWYTKK